MNIYRDEIIEHFNDPQNFGKLPKYDMSAKKTNPFCGDDIEMFVKLKRHPGPLRRPPRIDRVGTGIEASLPRIDSGVALLPRMTVFDISFVGKGCAISIAAASILTEFVKGKSVADLTQFSDEDMIGLLGVDLSETRKKCGLLALAALKDCLESSR